MVIQRFYLSNTFSDEKVKNQLKDLKKFHLWTQLTKNNDQKLSWIELRIGVSIRYLVTFSDTDYKVNGSVEYLILDQLCDEMTQCRYTADNIPQNSIDEQLPKVNYAWYFVPVSEQGKQALHEANSSLDLVSADLYIEYYSNLFINVLKRNRTSVEHHWFFKGKITIDGQEEEKLLIKMIIDTQDHPNKNNTIKFSDNSSAIRGFTHPALRPTTFTGPGKMEIKEVNSDLIFTAETHNMPTAVAPFSGKKYFSFLRGCLPTTYI